MLDPDYVDDQVLSDIMENMETEDPNCIKHMDANQAMDRFLSWNGIIGYTGTIIEAYQSLRVAESIADIREAILPMTDVQAIIFIQEYIQKHGHHDHYILLEIAKQSNMEEIRRVIC